MVVLTIILLVLNFIFGERPFEEIPLFLQPYSELILLVKPFLVYVRAVLVFIFGYLALKTISSIVYTYMRRVTDHPTAAAIKSVTRISGIAILLGLMASIFNVNPATALTVGSFGGLVVGFATQTILSHVIAGVFLLLSRPFAYGDIVTVAGQTGVVKEIRLMHLVLETEDRDILIPSGTVVTQILQKKKPAQAPKPMETVLALDALPRTISVGSTVAFRGRLAEAGTGNPVSAVTVKILERDFGRDDFLGSGTTDANGRFTAEWKAEKTDLKDMTAEVYAKFEGNDNYMQSQTEQYTLTLTTATDRSE